MEKHWPDWTNLVLGVWLLIAPFALQHTALSGAAWNAYIVGILIAAVAIGALSAFQTWEEWTNVILGVWLIIAPWTMGFSSAVSATWNQVIVGLLVVTFALWEMSLMKGQKEAHG